MSGAGKGLTQPTSTDGRPGTKPRRAGKGQEGQAMLIHLIGGDLLQVWGVFCKNKNTKALVTHMLYAVYSKLYSMSVTVQALYIEDLGLGLWN